MFIVLGILAFGIVIAVHEIGHYLSAKALGVKVNEFAIGMGPKLLSKQGKETLYSLRALPFGGFCAMEGEHEEGEEPDPRSFLSQKVWKRIIILASGSVANIVAAFIIILIMTIGAYGFVGTTITGLHEDFPGAGPDGLMAGDTIVSINGERLYYVDDFSLLMQINTGDTVDLVINRGGEKIALNNYPLMQRLYNTDGEMVLRYGISFNFFENNFIETLKYSVYQTYSFLRMIRLSIAMLVSGAVGITEVAGPVGIVSVMHNIGQEAPTVGIAILGIIRFAAFIGVNVAVINLLPIPAMDGGRILFTIITWIIEKVTRRHLDPKYEGYINTGAFILLICLMVLILYNDVTRLIGWGSYGN